MKSMKLRIVTGLGLLLFMATAACAPVEMNRARTSDGGGATLASLAGKFASKGSGSYTICFGASLSTVDCASSPHQEVPFNMTSVAHGTRDAAGNSCGVTALTLAATDRVFGAYFTRLKFARTNVSTTTSFDPTTGSGSASVSQYHGGSCAGAAFDSTGAILTGTGTQSFMVSDSGNRIDAIVTSFSMVTSPFGVAGSMKETVPAIKFTSIREPD
jgi:hypothetical protein